MSANERSALHKQHFLYIHSNKVYVKTKFSRIHRREAEKERVRTSSKKRTNDDEKKVKNALDKFSFSYIGLGRRAKCTQIILF